MASDNGKIACNPMSNAIRRNGNQFRCSSTDKRQKCSSEYTCESECFDFPSAPEASILLRCGVSEYTEGNGRHGGGGSIMVIQTEY